MFKYLVVLTVAIFCLNAQADEAKLKGILEKSYPQLGPIEDVTKAPINGLYEVETTDQIFYTDEKGQYLVVGSIYDIKNGRNLTDERILKSLPYELAIKRVKGKGERMLAYLTDPNCGYCKKLEGELKNVDNVTLYRFLYPIFPGSDEKVRNILCSKDPNKTWEDWMLNAVPPPVAKCSTQTEKVSSLGKKLHVDGTPTLIFADGRRVPGYMPVAELEKALNSAAAH